MAYAYPGLGKILYLGYSPGSFPAGGAEVVTYPLTATIADTEYSIAEPVNDSRNIAIKVVFTSAPGAISSVDIEYGSDPKLLDAQVIDTLTPGATDTMVGWQTSEPLNGFLRIKNTSGVDITDTRINKEVASWG